MITAEYRDNTLSIKGHAGYAEYGKDIVCACVSTAFYTYFLYAEELRSEGKLKEFSGRDVPGDAFIRAVPKEEAAEGLTAVREAVLGMLRQLAIQYPKHVETKL